jgi:hypothetical protein
MGAHTKEGDEKPEFLTTEDTETDEGAESGIEISRRGAGARREKIQ